MGALVLWLRDETHNREVASIRQSLIICYFLVFELEDGFTSHWLIYATNFFHRHHRLIHLQVLDKHGHLVIVKWFSSTYFERYDSLDFLLQMVHLQGR